MDPNNQHNFKTCTPYQQCTAIPTIVKDPSFRIQTALLWIRLGSSSARQKSSTRSVSSSGVTSADTPQVVLIDAVQGDSEEDAGTVIQEDQPDLGLLHFHRDRLAAAAEALGWRHLPCLEHTCGALKMLRDSLKEYCDTLPPLVADRHEHRKLRILVDRNGNISIDSMVINLYTPLSNTQLPKHPFMPPSFDEPPSANTPELCRVYIDYLPTRPSTLTTHKTTYRSAYNVARSRVNLDPTTPPMVAEVLLYNPNSEVFETSLCTIYFKRDGHWITPAAICGPNLGVTRRLAIEHKLCKQGIVELRDLEPNEIVWLSNAVRGFFRGILVIEWHADR